MVGMLAEWVIFLLMNKLYNIGVLLVIENMNFMFVVVFVNGRFQLVVWNMGMMGSSVVCGFRLNIDGVILVIVCSIVEWCLYSMFFGLLVVLLVQQSM